MEVLTTIDELSALADEWNALAAPFESPLLRHEWFLAAARACCPPDRLHVLVQRDGHTISGIAPLAFSGHGPAKTLGLLGSELHCEPGGFLYRNEDSLNRLFERIALLRYPTILPRVNTFSNEKDSIISRWKGLAWVPLLSTSASPWLPITSTWGDFEKSISSDRRYTLRRARKRAEDLGKVHLEIMTPREDEVAGLLDELFIVEGSGWKRRAGTSLQMNGRLRKFFHLYSAHMAREGKLRFGVMRIGGATVAAQLAVESANRYWVLKVGFDEAFARCSPGILLMHESLRYAYEKYLLAFEFLGSNEPWIRMWTERIHTYITYRLYPVNVHGIVGLGNHSSEMAWKKIRDMRRRNIRRPLGSSVTHHEV